MSMLKRDKTILLENIKLHRLEAYFYEIQHPEIYNLREQIRIRKKLATLAGSFPPKSLCVDVGSGKGNLCSHLNALDMETVACDLSKDMLKGNKAKHRILCDATYLPIKDGVSSLTTTYSFFHHVPDASSVAFEIIRIAAPKSSKLYFDHDNFTCKIVKKSKYGDPAKFVNYLIWVFFNPKYLKRLIEYSIYGKRRHKESCKRINFTLTDGNLFDPEEITQLLSKKGFAVKIAEYGYGCFLQANCIS
jgi:ubiquinone/menaquinone biosynthesis C-methylase UbiE